MGAIEKFLNGVLWSPGSTVSLRWSFISILIIGSITAALGLLGKKLGVRSGIAATGAAFVLLISWRWIGPFVILPFALATSPSGPPEELTAAIKLPKSEAYRQAQTYMNNKNFFRVKKEPGQFDQRYGAELWDFFKEISELRSVRWEQVVVDRALVKQPAPPGKILIGYIYQNPVLAEEGGNQIYDSEFMEYPLPSIYHWVVYVQKMHELDDKLKKELKD